MEYKFLNRAIRVFICVRTYTALGARLLVFPGVSYQPLWNVEAVWALDANACRGCLRPGWLFECWKNGD